MFKRQSKAQADWADLVIMLFTFILIFLFIGITFSNIGSGQNRVAAMEIGEMTAQQELLLLLKTPIELDGVQLQIVDIIEMWRQDASLIDQLKVAVGEVLTKSSETCVIFYPSYTPPTDPRANLARPLSIKSPRIIEAGRGSSCDGNIKYAWATAELPGGTVAYQYAVI
ncbi:MAG: hypothetical protein CMH61_01700 [Nanoarchaeota archaeon]|nr:hypothetical protein [Nanoarchaeota archaeon]|tara:strand:+ start:6313 stop:6819 length:507 start_codon:yes stop_codon:yes gene_type:complete